VEKLNETISGNDFLTELSLDELISKKTLDEIDEDLAQKVKNFGGGHYNHIVYFNLFNEGPTKPGKLLSKLIARDFGDFKNFEGKFKESSQNYFGSGWCWLIINKHGLKIKNTTNQDTPLNYEPCKVLMGLDLWEHSYYVDFRNRKKDYIDKIWEKINWRDLDNVILEAEYVK
jgi:Fe-Mn family superoxide dismutase